MTISAWYMDNEEGDQVPILRLRFVLVATCSSNLRIAAAPAPQDGPRRVREWREIDQPGRAVLGGPDWYAPFASSFMLQ